MKCPYKGKFRVSQEFKGAAHDGLDLVGLDSKNIYSTIDGVVEKAGWENPNNRSQGFGLYVRIKKDGSADRYYFGHLSKVKIRLGQRVKTGDLIGVEGSTGRSTGSHCHYCARGNASFAKIRNIPEISGIPNKPGTYTAAAKKATKKPTTKKSNQVIAKEVITGKWGNGAERKEKLTAAGYNYSAIQKIVNQLLK